VGRGDCGRTSPKTDTRDALCGPLLYEERSMKRIERSVKRIRKFFKSELGATAIEYGLIAALISVVIIAALQLTGNSLKLVFTSVGSTLSSSAN
jgi:pilus assembly protein Flp/PilA